MLAGFLKETPERYVTAAILIACVCALLLINTLWLTWLALGACYIACVFEATKLFKANASLLAPAGAVLIWIGAYFCTPSLYLALIAALIYASWLGFSNAFARDMDKNYWILALICYPTLPMLAMLDIYKDYGSVGLLWLIVIVAVCDSAAYFTGKAIGKIAFSPASPKKTLEGVVGGVIAATIFGALIGIAFLPAWKAIIIAFIVAVAGVFGDLFESSLKRGADMKDSGSLLPGHGGVLDRLDGHLFGAVALVVAMRVLF